MSLRSPMSRVLGLGAAKEGPGHWWSQRVTAVALVVLTLWFAAALLRMGTVEYGAVIAWIDDPVTAVLLALLIGALVYHSQLGVQVVIEDYVHGGAKVVTLLVVNFLHVVAGALGIFAVLRIAFGGAA
ncbi:MAG: succinate dehydrogenase, hydrophobic membrane anchor protein [Steroidobacter sp.]